MIASLFDALFGCGHTNYSFPRTSRNSQGRSEAASLTGTYVVCLDCGREFPYDWQEMKVISGPKKPRNGVTSTVESYAGK